MEADFSPLLTVLCAHKAQLQTVPATLRARNVWFLSPRTALILRQLFLPAAASFKDRSKNHRAHDKSFASDCIMYQQELWFQATVTVTVTRGYQQKVPTFTSLERDIIVMRKSEISAALPS